jgi:hypothetical protein
MKRGGKAVRPVREGEVSEGQIWKRHRDGKLFIFRVAAVLPPHPINGRGCYGYEVDEFAQIRSHKSAYSITSPESYTISLSSGH